MAITIRYEFLYIYNTRVGSSRVGRFVGRSTYQLSTHIYSQNTWCVCSNLQVGIFHGEPWWTGKKKEKIGREVDGVNDT